MTEDKKPYVKPTIIKLQSGLMNKFGASPYYARKVRTDIDGISIDKLVEQFGSPLFVFSERQIRNTVREAKEAFTSRYPNVTFGWSYKTNYLDAINAIFHQEGSIAEVVSEMEYDKARRLGIQGKDIIFNGPHKSLQALKKAAEEGAKIHIDHFDEIDDLEKVADELGRDDIQVAIRLNLDAGIYPLWSRFGFNLESGQAMDAVRRIHMGGKLKLIGLHCHIGTFILEPDAYKTETEKLVGFAYQIEEALGIIIEYLDIGGGFPSKNKLKGTYLPPDVGVPPLDTYAEKATEGLYNALKPGDFPQLYLETGRALIEEAGYLITTVVASKRLPDGRKSYVLDAGVNLLFTATWYKYTIETDREVQGIGEPALLNGPLCMNIDVVDEGTLLPPLKRGTRLILSPVGAYNVTQWMQFIEYRPAVVLVAETGEAELIREQEDLSDILRRERLPERLRLA
ncbi:MAG: diaminopimelate decarboxylase [Candidatus Parabeggiatoa sp. nov. 1]|nr:MAG: diaminopimelate decarboxylase [Gammaproteobacteria bacterium]